MQTGFIAPDVAAPTCHAPTIAETPSGLVAAFFAGSREGADDVSIWLSRCVGGRWSQVRKTAAGVAPDGTPRPCWNPVLHQVSGGPLVLFYKVGPNCADWWGMRIESHDAGRTWSGPQRLPAGVWGPIRNKPVVLADGALLCPSSTEHDGWRVHMERADAGGRRWEGSVPVTDAAGLQAIQPTILVHRGGRLQILCRTKRGCIATGWSQDVGRTWSPLESTPLPNPNSAVDAVMLRDGRALLVYNHSRGRRRQWGGPRTPLNIALSTDGVRWHAALVLEDGPGEYSYPAVVQAADGLVHVLYTWQRERIAHTIVTSQELSSGERIEDYDRRVAPDSAHRAGLMRPPWQY